MTFDLLIRRARIVDGLGGPAYLADVAISGDKIAAIGDLPDGCAVRQIDAEGRYLAPGFIDVHTHDDTNVIRQPDMLPKLSQGVTTVIVGNCGISASPVSLPGDPPDPMNLLGSREDFRYPSFKAYAQALEAASPSINVAALIGHTALRANLMDRFDRPASAEEIARMRELLSDALAQGAIGLSTGLAYINARHAPAEEIDALAAAVGAAGGIYATHLRNEFEGLPEAMHEAFDTARRADVPLVISHLKCAGAGNWGNAPGAIARLEGFAAEHPCNCDCYPYSASSSTLDPGQVTADVEIFITWSAPHPEMAQRTLEAIASQWGLTLLEAAHRLMPAGAVYHNMSEADMNLILAHPLTMVGSDGLPNDPHPHPRLWGTFPRVIAHYCRDRKLFELPEAIRKMTSLPATRFGLEGRGRVETGAFADLVLFDLDMLEDIADFAHPVAAARGIDWVIVNGQIAYHQGRVDSRAGRLLKRTLASAPAEVAHF
ncbi:N-acyl-D-amino-acid deacylase family protein [Halotalea alkalilenta]|uniref:D-aminoacylase n=1 Tax=Halotalea alkalilenta TaxID=376489 RepID=A0A172YBM6_9GAMM|nr:D-aminoacylase [Halotalea alkalilenta]ANF56651.1 D-aminoacylase [Halotalea alkalilenta]